MKKILTIVAIFSFLSSCQLPFVNEKIYGEGDVETEMRNLNSYDEIHVMGNFTVHLTPGKMGKISINAQKNLRPYIITESHKNKLKIGVKDGYNISSDEGLSVYVPIGNMRKLELSGSGSVVTDYLLVSDELEIELSGSGSLNLELTTNELECELSGSGNITLKGKTKEFDVDISGSGSIQADLMEAGNVQTEINGSGNIYVNSLESIKGEINGSGNVYYSGNPETKEFQSKGSGNFIQR